MLSSENEILKKRLSFLTAEFIKVGSTIEKFGMFLDDLFEGYAKRMERLAEKEKQQVLERNRI